MSSRIATLLETAGLLAASVAGHADIISAPNQYVATAQAEGVLPGGFG